MNSIFCVFGVFSAILAVNAHPHYYNIHRHPNTYYAQVTMTPPFYFGYNLEDYLNVKFNFTNLSPAVIYNIYEADFEQSQMKKTLSSYAGRDVYSIKGSIMKQRILIFVELKTSSGSCVNITILEGIVLGTKVAAQRYQYNKGCSTSYSVCTIVVDLKNNCTGPPSSPERPQSSAIPNTQATSATRDNDSGILSTSSPQNEQTTTKITANDNITGVFTYAPFVPTDQTLRQESIETTTIKFLGSDPTMNNVLTYVVSSVILMCALILVIYYATVDQVVYADLSMVHGDSQPLRHDDESPYAKIIGVMKPVDENIRKKKT